MGSIWSFPVCFFASKRGQTRCLSDWSSDVCSSDLVERLNQLRQLFRGKPLAGVPDADANRVRRNRYAVHDDLTAGFVVFDCVEKKIDENLLYPGSVGQEIIK